MKSRRLCAWVSHWLSALLLDVFASATFFAMLNKDDDIKSPPEPAPNESGNLLQQFQWMQERLQAGETLDIECVGSSMRPLVNDGERIRVKWPTRALKRFDLIVFFSGDGLVCHYISHLNHRDLAMADHASFVTRGLANGYADPLPVLKTEILGIVDGLELSLLRKFQCALLEARERFSGT